MALQSAIAEADEVITACGQRTPVGWDSISTMRNRTRSVQAECERALSQLSGLADWAQRKARKEATYEAACA